MLEALRTDASVHNQCLLLDVCILPLLWLNKRSELALANWIGGLPPLLHHASDCRRILVEEYPHHLAFGYLLGKIFQKNIDLGRERYIVKAITWSAQP